MYKELENLEKYRKIALNMRNRRIEMLVQAMDENDLLEFQTSLRLIEEYNDFIEDISDKIITAKMMMRNEKCALDSLMELLDETLSVLNEEDEEETPKDEKMSYEEFLETMLRNNSSEDFDSEKDDEDELDEDEDDDFEDDDDDFDEEDDDYDEDIEDILDDIESELEDLRTINEELLERNKALEEKLKMQKNDNSALSVEKLSYSRKKKSLRAKFNDGTEIERQVGNHTLQETLKSILLYKYASLDKKDFNLLLNTVVFE